MRQHHGSQRRAMRAALARLGLQAWPAKVVAALAGWGVAVTEALVRAVAFEVRREAARAEMRRTRACLPNGDLDDAALALAVLARPCRAGEEPGQPSLVTRKAHP